MKFFRRPIVLFPRIIVFIIRARTGQKNALAKHQPGKLIMKYFFIITMGILLASCSRNQKAHLPEPDAFRDSVEGRPTTLYLLKNSNGFEAAVTNYGARLVSLIVPDSRNYFRNVVLGYDSIAQYVHGHEDYFGATVGRYGNRIAKGRFSIDGREFILNCNDGPNHLHGGNKGFASRVWDATQIDRQAVEFSYTSKDGEEGYPGNVHVQVIYRLTDSNTLKINYVAVSDRITVINLTNHTYFNLNGRGSGTINNHLLQINADGYTPVDSTLIPTGKIEAVDGTPFDFRKPFAIGSRIKGNEQLKYGKGYDHNFVLNQSPGRRLGLAASVAGDRSKIAMDVWTTEPGIQFYGGNFLKGADYRTAFCLETQHFPDSPNEPAFPSTLLLPGKVYRSTTVYAFFAKDE